ncbi:MAG: baseplate J/gp47 family protein [Armatimonadota bacterium]|nr:baseplate J/gp47 family protein [Armatimonadota bacterium]
MTEVSKDRRASLLEDIPKFNGIDFVEVSNDQTTLRAHFFNKVSVKEKIETVTITGGQTIPTVPVESVAGWTEDGGHLVLTLKVKEPGDFSNYALTLSGPEISNVLDPYFASAQFSFKAGCPSKLDCARPLVACPTLPADLPPIDYMAKDFQSFRRAILDFSAERYPEWRERSEADLGMMFMEALCALADDLSYTQDRIAAEAYLDTATQRRSIVRHARLVDYEPRPATAARVLLQFNVSGNSLPSGLPVSAQGPDGAIIRFETGSGLVDPTDFVVSPKWNRIDPYIWDDTERCLLAGSTQMWVQGHDMGLTIGQLLLIETQSAPGSPPVREIVRLDRDPVKEFDPLYQAKITLLHWREDDALKYCHDLSATVVAGNLVWATQGRRFIEAFRIDGDSPSVETATAAVVRAGPNSAPQSPVRQRLYTLRRGPLAWLGRDDPAADPLPEIQLTQRDAVGGRAWTWRRSLLQAAESESAFTLDAVRFGVCARLANGHIAQDYAGDDGYTIRFGDGVFGEVPDSGASFTVTYRVSDGSAGNVAADSINRVDPSAAGAEFVNAVTNPFPAEGGVDEEPDERVKRLAPQRFRAKQFRAVRPEDYEKAACELPWVQRAGTGFRWTGSWLTVFTTVDPRGTDVLAVENHKTLIDLLNRYRMAGYESYALEPRYASLDLQVDVCAQPDAFQGDVEAAVLSALSAEKSPDGTIGFFHYDRFSFGMPLERSALEAAVQQAQGVAGVCSIHYRWRGRTVDYQELPSTLTVGKDEIVRVDNDPNRPDAGSLKVNVEGGK